MARPIDIRRIVNRNIKYYSDGMSDSELAEVLGVSYDTVHRRTKMIENYAFDVLQLNILACKFKCTVSDLVTPKEGWQ